VPPELQAARTPWERRVRPEILRADTVSPAAWYLRSSSRGAFGTIAGGGAADVPIASNADW